MFNRVCLVHRLANCTPAQTVTASCYRLLNALTEVEEPEEMGKSHGTGAHRHRSILLVKIHQNTHESGRQHTYKLGRRGSKYQTKVFGQKKLILMVSAIYGNIMLKIDKNRVLATQKQPFCQFSQSIWALKPCRSLCSRSVWHRLRFALKMAKTAKRAITCSVPRHTSN